MATKKQVPKKAARSAKPAKKAPAKPARPAGKPAVAKKAAKPVAKKPAHPAKKPVKKAAPAPKPAQKPMKKSTPPAKKAVAPVKKTPAPPVKVAAKPAPAKAAHVKEAPAKAAVHPVKKPAVAAPTHHEVKPAIKPLEKPAPKKEPAKPVKVVIPKTSTNKAVKYDPDFTRSVLDSPQHAQTGPTMRYSDSELTEFRDLILKKLDTAKKELAYLQGLITRKDEGDMEDGRYMTMEDGSMSMEREQLSQMASRQIQFIDHLEKAMMRIENKTYGICRVTGKLIDKARLRAVPHATLSIEAKQMMNK
jgi:RNA polymerase-binding transcription factor DksA